MRAQVRAHARIWRDFELILRDFAWSAALRAKGALRAYARDENCPLVFLLLQKKKKRKWGK
jgi:hypothetical protein